MSFGFHGVNLRVQNDVEDHDAQFLDQIVDAVVVSQYASDVARNRIKSRFSRVSGGCIASEVPDAGKHFVLGFFGADEGSAL